MSPAFNVLVYLPNLSTTYTSDCGTIFIPLYSVTRASKTIKELGKHPKDEKDIVLMEGRYGPFVKHGKVNASIPKDMNLDDVNLELAVELIKNRKKKKKK